jgi:hypothetical protein
LTKKLFAVALMCLLLFSFGCAQPKRTVIYGTGNVVKSPVSEVPVAAKTSCDDITCNSNEECRNGKCYCISGFRKCNEKCISRDSCCADSDCKLGFDCIGNECKEECNSLKCESNKVCNDNNECDCEFGEAWCSNQEKCIPSNACCNSNDCSGSEICRPAGMALDLCFESNDMKNHYCERIVEGSTKSINAAGIDYSVKVLKVLKDSSADVQIGTTVYRNLLPDTKYLFSQGMSFYTSNALMYGGKCELDEE